MKGRIFFREYLVLVYIQWFLNINCLTTEESSDVCNSPLTERLGDHMFSASSFYSITNNASAARKDKDGWIAAEDDRYQYLQVDLGNITDVNKLEIQGSTNDWYSRSIRVSYSLDGLVWTSYNSQQSTDSLGEIFTVSSRPSTIILDPILKTRYIAINPISYYRLPALRLELFGCESSRSTPAEVVGTHAQNIIDVDTAWIPSQSPILVDDIIVIRPSVTLTIEAGVSVIFRSGTSGIDVWGTLVSNGLPDLDVLLTSNEPVIAAHSRWIGIVQKKGGTLSMTNTMLRQAVSGVQGNARYIGLLDVDISSCLHGIRLSGGSADNSTNTDIEHAKLVRMNLHNNVDGLVVHGTSSMPNIFINHSTFEQNSGSGIIVLNWDSNEDVISPNFIILNSTFSKNSYGINAEEQLSSSFSIKDSKFVSNTDCGFYIYIWKMNYYSKLTVDIDISNSEFRANEKAGIYTHASVWAIKKKQPPQRISIKHNRFSNERYAIDIGNSMIYVESKASIHIDNNTFSANTYDVDLQYTTDGHVQISTDYNTFLKSRFPLKLISGNKGNSNASVRSNIFDNCFFKSSSDEAIRVKGVTTEVLYNRFNNCFLSTMLVFEDGTDHTFAFNVLNNTTVSRYFVTIKAEFENLNSLDIDFNYWGTSNMKYVKSKVYDFFHDSTKALAKLSNFYTTKELENVTKSHNVDDFSIVTDSAENVTYIGGMIRTDYDFASISYTDVTVNQSILIMDGVVVHISGVAITMLKNRGVLVYGTLTLGDRDGSETSLKLNGEYSYFNKWSGFRLHSGDLNLYNLVLSGADTFIDVMLNGSSIVLYNCSSTDNLIDNLVIADIVDGNFSLTIENSSITTSASVLYVRYTFTNINITVLQSNLGSDGKHVLDVIEKTDHENHSHLNLDIKNSFLFSNSRYLYDAAIFIGGCSSSVTLSLTASTLTAVNYADLCFIKSAASSMTIHENNFNQASDLLSIEFCDEAPETVLNLVNISGNVFNSSNSGKFINIYSSGRVNRILPFHITNNTFDGQGVLKRTGVSGTNAYTKNIIELLLDSNVFRNIGGTAVYVKFGSRKLKFSNNLFQENGKCISIHGQSIYQAIEGVVIHGNTFINNAHTDGIVYIDRGEYGPGEVNITNNHFKDNGGTVIAFTTSEIRLTHNFFENPEAIYNLRNIYLYTSEKKEVNASLNFWGSTSVREIKKGIYDYNYDESLLQVVFRPYLGSKNLSDIQDADSEFLTDTGEVGGDVNGNVTLHLKESPYIVISNIKVNENDTLTIEAGVELKVKPGVGIYVQGKLHVLGSKDLPVSVSAEKAGQPWIGLHLKSDQDSNLSYLFINDTVDGMTVTGSFVQIQNLTSSYSSKCGISIMVQNKVTYTYSFLLDEVVLEHNGEDGILVSGSSSVDAPIVQISNCVIARNVRHGVNVDSDATIEIMNCSIIENKDGGIDIKQRGDGLLFVNNSLLASNANFAIEGTVAIGIVMDYSIVRNNSYGYFKRYTWWNTRAYISLSRRYWFNKATQLVFKNTNFEDNPGDWFTIVNRYVSSELTIVFENNTFFGGKRVIVINNYNDDEKLEISLRDNTFENNTVEERYEDSALLEIYQRKSAKYEVDIVGNIFKNNVGRACLYISSSGDDMQNDNMTIVGNVFLKNNMSESVIDIKGHILPEVHRNTFVANQSVCSLRTVKFHSTHVINATHNYWGSSVAKEVIETVCGFEKDMEQALILIFPYYEDEIFSSLAYPTEQNKVRTFGGEIKTDTFVAEVEWRSPIKVYRSILIRENATLYIQAGIELQFAENRGIYVEGTLIVIGNENSVVVLESMDGDSYWHGIIINSTKPLLNSTTQQKSKIHKTILKRTKNGIVAESMNFEIRQSHITSSLTNCLTLLQTTAVPAILDFLSTKFDTCGQYGVFGTVTGNVTLTNAYITNTLNGVSLNIVPSDSAITVDISKNTFLNVTGEAISVALPENDLMHPNGDKLLRIENNIANASCGIIVKANDFNDVIIRNNEFTDAICSPDNLCFMRVLTNNSKLSNSPKIDISANRFEDLRDDCIVLLNNSNSNPINGHFMYNTMLLNDAKDGVIINNARNWTVSHNVFDNPSSVFDMVTHLKGSYVLNVTNNWWGSSNKDNVYTRIHDQRRDPDLVIFDVVPVLAEFHVDCTGVNNCSKNGKCVSPNHCSCYSGWSGQSCDIFDCVDVNNCYGNGDCIGPNSCSCYDGWSGSQCTVASCSDVNNCSGRGYCIRPNVCICAARYTGRECDSCLPNYGGPSCQPCPVCKHGTCSSETGLCVCDGDNWTGFLCDKCMETYYGMNCLPLMKLLEILPDSGSEIGGNEVHVWGHNFKDSPNNTYTCRFGSDLSEGKRIAWNHVVCVAPRRREGTVTLEVSADGSEYTNDGLTYRYYSTCPSNACGRGFNPSRGQCIFGACSCFLPWTGDNCTIELYAPEIALVEPRQTLTESETFNFQLQLIKGEHPVRWYLYDGPLGMTVGDVTGLVTWESPSANIKPYLIDIRVSNIAGEASVTWTLDVLPSYTVQLDYIEPSGILLFPTPITIFGTVVYFQSMPSNSVPVTAIVTSQRTGHSTFLHTVTSPTNPTKFKTVYYPRPDDAGLFTLVAKHPGVPMDSNVTRATWSVLGMVCKPSIVDVSLKLNQSGDIAEFYKISTLLNVGDNPIESVTYEVRGLPGVIVRKTGDKASSFELSRLDVNARTPFDLIINNAVPLQGIVLIIFKTPRGTSTAIQIRIKLSVQKPNLQIDPPSLRENIVRGTIKLIEVNVTNTGDVSAFDVIESLPNDHRLSTVSFSVENKSTNISDDKVSLQPKESARLVLSVITDENEALGELRGIILLNSRLTSTSLPYKFVITSTRRFNVTFTVKDEFTYFATDAPLVGNSKVTLSNPRRSFSETRYTTNETGYVIFEDVYEDQYSLYAGADDHSSYAAVILVTPDDTDQDIFLQRTAVKYTWTVEPTTVKDVYRIELNSTFETYVPMPVVTIEPAYIDTLPLEASNSTTIEFTITNHGLIRADNVRFSLPTTHPNLIFKSEVDTIGRVPANTSIIVPVKTVLRSREKRASGSVCLGFCLLYDFTCGSVQTRCASVKLTRGGPGLSCFTGIHLSGGSGGGSWHYNAGYVSSTPISCDCMKTFIKSCVLAFIPGFGCPLAVHGAMSMIEKGSKEMNVKDSLIGLMDIIVGCFSEEAAGRVSNRIIKDLLLRNLPVLEHMYTAVRCVMDMEAACSKKRKRREISSDVINAVVVSARPMENFLNIGLEIFGNLSVPLEEEWYNEFRSSMGDDTDLGILISSGEGNNIVNSLPETASKQNLTRFLDRFNDTASAWNNGSLSLLENSGRVINFSRLTPMYDRFLEDMANSKEKGFDSIFAEYEQAITAYNKAEEQSVVSGSKKRDGVCARVRIRIEQELVLTRDAFKARIEIENGESADLENILVEIQIQKTYGSTGLLNDKFSIGKPSLVGISGVGGEGSISKDMSGSAEWLIIPYSNAAPEGDTLYNIGGRLSYTVDGTYFSTSLLPDTITVKPNPNLIVHYFHEKYVRGDDALTPKVEPIIPFTLAVMVTNDGYGVARALKISSGQPEIVENEKGLLITFKIIGAQLGNTPISPSLTVNFGDIAPFETKTARWLMTSTLMGTFFNYSALFQNINPLGDPQLSLIETLRDHELFHLVRITNNDDDLDDFLVNDFPDQESIPERIYNSANSSDVFNVAHVNITNIHAWLSVSESTKEYKHVQLTLNTNTSSWIYARVVNNFISSIDAVDEQLLSAERKNGGQLIIEKNVWQTTHIFETFYVHLVDFVDLNRPSDTEIVYTLTYGPRNTSPPRFSAKSFNATISREVAIDYEVLQINAYDFDKDSIRFSLTNVSKFRVIQTSAYSAVLLVREKLTSTGEVIMELIAEDDGVPPRSAAVNISIKIIGDGSEVTTSSKPQTTKNTYENDKSKTSTKSTSPLISTNTKSTSSIDKISTAVSSTTIFNPTDSTEHGGADSSTGIPSWVIPASIAAVVVIVLAVIAGVCIVRRGVCSPHGTDNILELK